jgi:hypothetical protein
MKLIERIRAARGKASVKRFDDGLAIAAERATELFNQKGQAVVCVYCGKLLPKSEAAYVYVIAENRGEYSHEECFQKYERHGTLEDLEQMMLEEKQHE